MKKILTLALAFSCGAALAQKADNVGIGTTKPDPSAILDLNSNTKGLLLPRMNQAQRDAIKNPAAGLVIFQTDQAVGTYTFDGTAWQPSNARTSAVSSVGAWDKQGNVIDGTDFLGSTNNFPLIFKVNGVKSGTIASDFNSNTYFGYSSGTTGTGSFGTGIGHGALVNNAGIANIGIGNEALRSVSGVGNIGIGVFTLQAGGSGVVSGSGNIGVGHEVLPKNLAGENNVAIGFNAMKENTGGSANFGLGAFALQKNTTGSNNVALGAIALQENLTGAENVAIGAGALNKNTNSSNVAIGTKSLFFNTGTKNVGIGPLAGENATGSRNVFIGNEAGRAETGSDLLYIANSNAVNPLIKGSFDSNWLKINSKTAGYLAVGDFDAGTPMPTPAGYRLIVQDGILTEKLKVALRTDGMNWADYVFESDYKLMPLEEVEKYTKANKHLPNVPSADEITKEGIDVAKVSKMFMEKIEELTLHIIELNKRIKELETKK